MSAANWIKSAIALASNVMNRRGEIGMTLGKIPLMEIFDCLIENLCFFLAI